VDFEEHKTRFRTLQAIAREYAAAPHCFGVVKVWRPQTLERRHAGDRPVDALRA
jgi:hypothetical protein